MSEPGVHPWATVGHRGGARYESMTRSENAAPYATHPSPTPVTHLSLSSLSRRKDLSTPVGHRLARRERSPYAGRRRPTEIGVESSGKNDEGGAWSGEGGDVDDGVDEDSLWLPLPPGPERCPVVKLDYAELQGFLSGKHEE